MIGFLTDMVCRVIIAPFDHIENTHREAEAFRRQYHRKQALCKKTIGHSFGPWELRSTGGYQKRTCTLCDDFEFRPTPE